MTITLDPAVIPLALVALFWAVVIVCSLRTPKQRTPWTPPPGYMLEPTTSQAEET